MRLKIIRKLPQFLACAMIFLRCVYTPPQQEEVVPAHPDDWGEGPVHQIFLSLRPDDLEYLLDNPFEHGDDYEMNGYFTARIGEDTMTLSCGIRIHGNTSRQFIKKSFRIYFNDEKLSSECLFGDFPAYEGATGRFSELVLNANAIDFSCIRNYLAMYVQARLGGFAPRIAFAELNINGKPYGLYTVNERPNEDMAHNIVGHNDYDLIKSADGNMTMQDHYYDADSYEVKKGDTISLFEFMRWQESDSFSYEGVKQRWCMPSVFALLMGCMYSSDIDALYKNFYYIFDRRDSVAYFVPWDADATFGRSWNGCPLQIDECACRICSNGLYRKLMEDEDWKEDVRQRFEDAFEEGLNQTAVNQLLDSLEVMLEEPVLRNNVIWKDSLLQSFATYSSTTDTSFAGNWEDDPADPLYIWKNELSMIRSVIASRQKAIDEALEQKCPPYPEYEPSHPSDPD
jgi:hypothetical protein